MLLADHERSFAHRILHTLYRSENISSSYSLTSRGITIRRRQHFAEVQTGFRENSQSLKSCLITHESERRGWKAKSQFMPTMAICGSTKLRSLFGRRDDIKYRRRIGNSREEIVNFLLALISEANHLELLRQPTNHFQPSVPDRRQFQYISRDYKHSEGLINFALSHRPYPWASY